MANNTDSNITRQLLRRFLPDFEAARVLSKAVDTQTFQGRFNPASGDYVDIKKPHRYIAKETATGDISALTANSITSGKATAQVQQYLTVDIDWTNKEEALSLDQLTEILRPAATELVTKLETNFCEFMYAHAALSTGYPDLAINQWSHLAQQMSMMKAMGVPGGPYYSVMNPFTIQNLASVQTGLSADPSRLVQTAWEMAQISTPFAGMRAISSNSMSSYTTGDAGVSGTLSATPDATYLTHKDTYVQSLAVTGLTAAATVTAGTILEFSGTGALARSYIQPITRKTIFGADGGPIPWRCVVTEDVVLDGTGAGTLLVSGPAIFEANGQYNNISAALTSGDAFDVLGTADTEYQPDLFFTKDAFSIAFVKLPKLFSTDTVAVQKDGVSIRCSKYADGDANTQKIRFDILPAYGVMNPWFAGQGFGSP